MQVFLLSSPYDTDRVAHIVLSKLQYKMQKQVLFHAQKFFQKIFKKSATKCHFFRLLYKEDKIRRSFYEEKQQISDTLRRPCDTFFHRRAPRLSEKLCR